MDSKNDKSNFGWVSKTLLATNSDVKFYLIAFLNTECTK
jgi:hypothetical protein